MRPLITLREVVVSRGSLFYLRLGSSVVEQVRHEERAPCLGEREGAPPTPRLHSTPLRAAPELPHFFRLLPPAVHLLQSDLPPVEARREIYAVPSWFPVLRAPAICVCCNSIKEELSCVVHTASAVEGGLRRVARGTGDRGAFRGLRGGFYGLRAGRLVKP
mgnify:FL=1